MRTEGFAEWCRASVPFPFGIKVEHTPDVLNTEMAVGSLVWPKSQPTTQWLSRGRNTAAMEGWWLHP